MVSLFDSRRGFSWAGLAAFLVIIAGVVAFSNVATRECSKDTQCGSNSYCGADFSCHAIQVITVEKTEYHNDFAQSALIVAIAIVISALILKKWQ